MKKIYKTIVFIIFSLFLMMLLSTTTVLVHAEAEDFQFWIENNDGLTALDRATFVQEYEASDVSPAGRYYELSVWVKSISEAKHLTGFRLMWDFDYSGFSYD